MPTDPSDAGSMRLDEAARLLAATPTRLKVVRCFLDNAEVTAPQLMAAVGLSRNAAGHHLTALRDAGLLQERRAIHPRGQGIIAYWAIDREAVHALRDVIHQHLT